ncbi:MAG: hypothetical protein BWY52_02944 [Chloroflexi bacterium ADurb.Bin325]|nr:MAG: hypothetical protein BWY52_02944 [Chloroflexi bacterium ADurb.Bin325]
MNILLAERIARDVQPVLAIEGRKLALRRLPGDVEADGAGIGDRRRFRHLRRRRRRRCGRRRGRRRLRARQRLPLVPIRHRLPKVLDDAHLAVDAPLIHIGPAIEDHRADELVARLPVPPVDLAVGALHPADVLVAPRLVLIRLGQIDGQPAHGRRDRPHEVLVSAEVILSVLEGRVHERVGVDESRVCAVRVSMDRDAVTVARAYQVEDILQILDPVAVRVAIVGRLRIPGRDRADDDLVVLMARDAPDRVAALAIAVGVHRGQDDLAGVDDARRVDALVEAHAGPLDREVHLVADDPDVTPARAAHEVGAALGELSVAVGEGDRAVRLVAVVEPHDDAEALVGPPAIVAAALVAWIVPHGLGKQNPAVDTLLRHDVFAARVVDAIQIWRVVEGSRHRLAPSYTSARRPSPLAQQALLGTDYTPGANFCLSPQLRNR